MENNDQKYRQLDAYLHQAKNILPLSSLNEVQHLIENAGGHSKYTSHPKSQFTLKYKIIMSTSIIAVLAILGTFLYPRASKTNLETKLPVPHKSVAAGSNQAAILNAERQSKLIKLPVRYFTGKSMKTIEFSDIDPWNPVWTESSELNQEPVPIPNSGYHGLSGEFQNLPVSGNIMPVELSNKQLQSIGFVIKQDQVIYKAMVQGLGDVIFNAFPVGSQTNIGKVTFFPVKSDFYAAFITDISGNEICNFDSTLHHNSPGYTNDNQNFSLVPVLLKDPTARGKSKDRDLLFWFTVTPSFLKKINDKSKNDWATVNVIQSAAEQKLYLKPSNPQNETVLIPETKKPDPIIKTNEYGFPEIKPFNADEETMTRIGFSFENEKVIFTSGITNASGISYAVLPDGSDMSIGNPIPNPKERDYYPVYITAVSGTINGDEFENIDSVLQAQHVSGVALHQATGYTNFAKDFQLLPVLVKRPGLHDPLLYKDLVFWFKVTPSLLADIQGKTSIDKYIVNVNRAGIPDKEYAGKQDELKYKTNTTLNGIVPLTLDKAHLYRLGFYQSKNGLEYKTTIKNTGTLYYANHYHSIEGLHDAFLEINGRNKYFSGTQGHASSEFHNLKNQTDKKVFAAGSDFYPLSITEKDGDENLNIYQYLAQDALNSNDTSSICNVVPVLIKQSDFNEFVGKKDLIFWFKATPTFYSLIHDINQNEIRTATVILPKDGQVILPGMVPAKNNAENGIIDPMVSSVKYLELDNNSLTKLGFSMSNTGVKYNCIITSTGKFNFVNSPSGYGIAVEAPLVFTGKGQDFYPVFISDRNGNQTFKYRFSNIEDKDKWTDNYFLSAIRKLVPVLVKQDFPGSKNKNDLIFWFNVTPAFLEALPETVATDLNKEYQILMRNAGAKKDSLVQTSCTYFDVCQLPLEKQMNVNIYPNPAQSKLNIDFELTGNTSAILEITDLNGKVVKAFGKPYSGAGGLHIETDISEIKAGIYLVVLKLSSGEVLTHKVLITSGN